jgi:hypothetical protein
MNEYGRQAMAYWQRRLPTRYGQIQPQQRLAFFTDLGEQTLRQIERTEEALLARDQAGHLSAIRAQAREIVEKEMIFLDPEVSEDPDLDRPDRHRLSDWMDPQGMPLDHGHRLWAMLEDETVPPQEFAAAAAAWEDSLWRQVEAAGSGTT